MGKIDVGNQVLFGVLYPDGVLRETRYILQSDTGKCPHFIMVASHYREDGSCKCDDKGERQMMIREWEYTEESFAGIPLRKE